MAPKLDLPLKLKQRPGIGRNLPAAVAPERAIGARKDEHLDVVLKRDVGSGTTRTGLDSFRFAHVALPELALADIDLSAEFVGRKVRAPLLISSMTGGPARAQAINENIAIAAQAMGIGFGVGSQRIALENGQAGGFSRRLRQLAPDVPILANFGAAQLRHWDGPEMARRAVGMIEADALIIHLNPLQEALQEHGDGDWRDVLCAIETVCRNVSFKVVVKEVGFGISGKLAAQLVTAGVWGIDVAGAGGTSWAAVEGERARSLKAREIAMAFRSWGVPTAQALRDVRSACPDVMLIASGGLRDGIDCAKAIRLGATMTAMAGAVLPDAIAGADLLAQRLDIIIEQLRIACFCTGSANLDDLARAQVTPAAFDGADLGTP